MDKEESKENYINLLHKIAPGWEKGEIQNKAKKGATWVVLSQPVKTDEIEDSQKTICDWIQAQKDDVVKKLIEEDRNLIFWTDDENRTPLHFSVDSGNTELVKFLLSKKANINVQDKEGQTPLHYACVCEHEEIVNYLVTNGADVNQKDASDESPLDIAPNLINPLIKK